MALCANSRGTYLVRGIVRDSVDNQPIPYASVSIPGGHAGTTADSHGIFEISLPDTAITLRIYSQGYMTKNQTITKNRVNLYAVYLSPTAQTLGEVRITKQRYTKHNPAVLLMQRVRAAHNGLSPLAQPWYSHNKYQRISLALNELNAQDSNKGLMQKYPFLWNHVDTSDVTGKTILNISVGETTSEVHHRGAPRAMREVVTGETMQGLTDLASNEAIQQFYADVLQETDVFQNDITLLGNRFVSPFSGIAPDFYRFYITDSIKDANNNSIYTLSFYPRNKASFGFIGQMEIVDAKPGAWVRSLDLRVSPEINLNFVTSLAVHQEYELIELTESQQYGSVQPFAQVKNKDILTLEVNVLPGTQGLYVKRILAFDGHDFVEPAESGALFSGNAVRRTLAEAYKRPDEFWAAHRLEPITPAESRIRLLMENLRSLRGFRILEKGVKIMYTGYIPTGKPSRWDFGPVNTLLSYNSLEGLRTRIGGMTLAAFSPHIFLRGYCAWGFKDHKFKYGSELEYSFNSKEKHGRQWPVRSLLLSAGFDVARLGQNYAFTQADNFVLSLQRGHDNMMAYAHHQSLTFTWEWDPNFTFTLGAVHRRLEPSRLLQFTRSDGQTLSHVDNSWLEASLRFAPGEQFYQGRTQRLPVSMDYPVFSLSHISGPSDLGTTGGVHRTEAAVRSRLWLSAWGYLDLMARGGHVWSHNTPYPYLFTPNANMSYTIQPESFALVEPMEFISSSYCWLDATYWANGAILNYLPLIRKLKLREVFAARSYWGTLSDANNPGRGNLNVLAFPGMGVGESLSRTPYIEVSAGLDNIFRVLRFDWVWRLTHHHPAHPVTLSGPRIALHITF